MTYRDEAVEAAPARAEGAKAARTIWTLLGCAAVLALAGAAAPPFGVPIFEGLRGQPIRSAGNLAAFERTLVLFSIGCAGLALLLAAQAWLAAREPPAREEGEPEEGEAVGAPVRGRRSVAIALCSGVAILAPLVAGHLDRPFDYDESIALVLDVSGPLWSPLAPRAFANHVLSGWIARPGWSISASEAGARSVFFGFALAAVGIAGRLAFDLTRRAAAAVVVASLYATHWLFAIYSVSIRGYILVWFAFTVLTALWVVASERRERRRFARPWTKAAVAAVAALGGSAHLFGAVGLAVWVVLGMAAWGLRRPGRDLVAARALLPSMSLGLVASFLVWTPSLPWLFFQTGGGLDGAWRWKRLGSELRSVLGFPAGTGELALALGLAFVLATVALAWRRHPALRLPIGASATILLAATAAAWLASPDFYFARFLVATLPPLLIAVAAGSASLRQGTAGGLGLAALFAVGALAATGDFADARSAIGSLDALVRRSAETPVVRLGGPRSERIVTGYYSRLATADTASDVVEPAPGDSPFWYAVDGSRFDLAATSRLASSHCRIVAQVAGSQSDFVLWARRDSWACGSRGGRP